MLFLQPQDYYINPTGQMCINMKGFCMVFYTSDRCTICKRLKPQFNQLSKSIQGCTFAYMNVDQENMKIRKMAAQASQPIDHVPIFLLFLDGIPMAVFNLNEKTKSFVDDLRQWLINTTTQIVRSVPERQPQRDSLNNKPKDDVCPTSIGKAKPAGRGVSSYKSYEGAYGNAASTMA